MTHVIQKDVQQREPNPGSPDPNSREANPPYIDVYEPIAGWKPRLIAWDPDMYGPGKGGYDVWQIGMIGHANKENAIKEGKSWARAEGIEFRE